MIADALTLPQTRPGARPPPLLQRCESLGRLTTTLWVLLWVAGLAITGPVRADPVPSGGGETVEQALCRLIGSSAEKEHLPVGFLTRLIWQESSFRAGAVSPVGAQGVAQFMPGTARERGLADPFDPEQAIPAAASLLADLSRQFGNLGLAAAAYNGGPARVATWLAGKGGLPFETQDYVTRITGSSPEDWAAALKTKVEPGPPTPASCIQLASTLRNPLPGSSQPIAPFAPWGVQLAGNFSKSIALASFSRARGRYGQILADVQPMIIGTRLRTRGTRRFYRVRVPAQTRAAAIALCGRIHAVGGSCLVLRSA